MSLRNWGEMFVVKQLKFVVISFFLAEGAQAAEAAPTLVALPDVGTERPLPPVGKHWKMFAEIYGDPRDIIIGRQQVDRLLAFGYVVSHLPIEDIIKHRPAIQHPGWRPISRRFRSR